MLYNIIIVLLSPFFNKLAGQNQKNYVANGNVVMNYQINVNLPSGKVQAFLQNGFFSTIQPSGILHKHRYGEIHVISGGTALFRVGGEEISVSGTSIIFIPSGMFHTYLSIDKDSLHSAFQIESGIKEVTLAHCTDAILQDFFRELSLCGNTNNFGTISSYISLFCGYLDKSSTLYAKPINDYGFLIHEFFTNNYTSSITLTELAEVLHLSSRQAERLVIEHTGNSFRDELCKIRVTVAKELLKTTNMSLTEVSRYVGYRSYAGFYKAMRRYEKRRCFEHDKSTISPQKQPST